MHCQIVTHLEGRVHWLDIGLTNKPHTLGASLFDSTLSHDPVIGF